MVTKIVLAGKNNIAIEVAEFILLHFPKIKLYALTNNNDSGVDGWQRSYKKFCLEREIELINLEKAYEFPESLFLSVEFDRLIKPNLFVTDKLFNIHFSLLPAYKGMYTSALPFLYGETYSGVSLHEIDVGIDTGDLLAQHKIKLTHLNNAFELYEEYLKEGARLIIENLPEMLNGTYKKFPQPIDKSSYYSKKRLDYANLELQLNQTAWQIKNQIRAYSFRPFQLITFNQKPISLCNVLLSKSNKKIGEIIFEDKNKFTISTIDYDVELIIDKLDELLAAVKTGCTIEVKDILTTNPSLINAKNKKGWNAIIVAAYNGHIELLNFLYELGADINSQNVNGTTVLMYAKDNALNTNSITVFDTLINLGADRAIKDFYGKDVFDYIKTIKNNETVKLLNEYVK